VPSSTAESVTWEAERAELQTVLGSPLFVRSPTLTHLLSYLCEKTFAGETDQIKEYSVALDVFDRRDTFDQDTDSIVRVQANRLRKRLSQYYAVEGAAHAVHITIPVGQYVPLFQKVRSDEQRESASRTDEPRAENETSSDLFLKRAWFIGALISVAVVIVIAIAVSRPTPKSQNSVAERVQANAAPVIGLPVGDELHILAGSTRKYVDHAGKVWTPDLYFSGGSAIAGSVQHIWRTLDPIIYRNSRQGDFAYGIPLKPGVYELRLHFAENLYGPESESGGGEGSRTMSVTANGQMLLRDFDVLADAGDGRTADVKVFSDITPASDGQLHLSFSSGKSGSAMVSGIEILPAVRGHLRPVRIVARDVPYYSNDSRWWSPDTYFKGGQLSSSQEPAQATEDPEFYESERWGHFSYAIPVAPGRYTVTLHFIEHHGAAASASAPAAQDRVFNVFCNGKTIVPNLNIVDEVGENRPLVRKVKGLEPNAQGKLLLEFVPVAQYATVTAIEVVAE
jgi:malectin (di-glucose binding ER protein)